MSRSHPRALQSAREAKNSGSSWHLERPHHAHREAVTGRNEDGSSKWSFPASAGAVKHKEWEMREILAHISLVAHTQEGRSAVGKDITQFHYEMGYWNDDECNDVTPEDFFKVRPDGVAFNTKVKVCAFLEFTGPMDSRDGISEQPAWHTVVDWALDWAEDKDLRKNTRYDSHLEFTWWASKR